MACRSEIKLSKRFKSGFTLVELLVVIGIISFLMALIVPALGRARDQSKLIICRSNQRNLLLGCLMYASENDSRLPVDKQLHNTHTGLIESLSGGGYIQVSKIYYCPSEKADDLKYSEDNFRNGNIGYFYYSFSDRPTDRYLSTFFLKKLPWPRLLSDMMKDDKWVFSDSWFSNMPTAHRWYKKGVNYITLDGSVHMVKQSPKREFN
ncbi:MAG: type II secretion system protein [Planctomycetes bacterium]|nr:type II secretion system protein [Planctomycetota bacterium]